VKRGALGEKGSRVGFLAVQTSRGEKKLNKGVLSLKETTLFSSELWGGGGNAAGHRGEKFGKEGEKKTTQGGG